MTSVSEVVKDEQRAYNITHHNVEQDEIQTLEQVTVMQGSIWEYSDSQPWFLLGLRKNNPTATRHELESIMKIKSRHAKDETKTVEKRRGTLSLNGPTSIDNGTEVSNLQDGKTDTEGEDNEGIGISLAVQLMNKNFNAKYAHKKEVKIVIKKTIELVSEMSKSCELVFHAVRACARFLTYPTPSIPGDNHIFGHLRGWVWLIHKGLSHFNHDKTNVKSLDSSLKRFRKEMSLLAKEANGCVSDLSIYIRDLRKLNVAIKKEAKLLKKHKPAWGPKIDRYFRFVDDLKSKQNLLVDIHEDRFFPTSWIFEPHPSQTKLQWDFFHFQWVDLNRDWVDFEFELRSDYSLHWTAYSLFSPGQQTEIIVHMIQHLKALIEECHQFHRTNMRLSFDTQEIKFLKLAVDEIVKLKIHPEAVEDITDISKKLFEDLAVLEKISEDYLSHFEWFVTIVEPCYRTMSRWLADDLILPLEFSARIRNRRRWSCRCKFLKRKKTFLEDQFFKVFGEPLRVVMLRSPISMSQLEHFFASDKIMPEGVLEPAPINAFGTSEHYISSIFDAGLGREEPLPIHHPLPKFKRQHEQKCNIFDIHRLIELSVGCVVVPEGEEAEANKNEDVDTEKFLLVVEEIQRFLVVFSSIFSTMMTDSKELVETMELLMYDNLPEYYERLGNMILYESSKHIIESSEKSGTKVFNRLLKIFQFVVYFLEKANALEGDDDSTYYASKAAYYKSYSKVQSWINQKAAIFSMFSLPSKADMFSSLFSESEKTDIASNVQEFVMRGYKLIETCESVMKKYNISTNLL